MTAAGWYPDLASDEVIRYWDGERWTEERAWDGSGWVDRALGSTIQETAGPAPHTGGPARNLNETVVGGLIETSDPIAASSPPPAPPAASVDSTFVESAPAPPAASVDSTFVESAPAPPGASVVVPPPLPMPGGGPPLRAVPGSTALHRRAGPRRRVVSAAVTFLVIRAGDNSGASPAEPSTTTSDRGGVSYRIQRIEHDLAVHDHDGAARVGARRGPRRSDLRCGREWRLLPFCPQYADRRERRDPAAQRG